MNNKLSILLPLKDINIDLYKRCINSIISQSYQNFEVIVKYNGSINEFEEIKSYTSDNRFIYINEPDTCVANAGNQAMRHVTGDLITLFCHDDEYIQDAFSLVINNIGDAKWCFGYIRFHVDNQECSTYYKPDPNMSDMLRANYIPQPGCFFRKEVYDTVGQFDDSFLLCWDYDYWIRIMKLYPPKNIPYYIANYYMNNNSISRKYGYKFESEEKIIRTKYFI